MAYTVAAVGPLVNAEVVYVAVIVRTQDKEKIIVSAADSEVFSQPDYCEEVVGKQGETKESG